MSKDSHILSSITLTNAAIVFAESHIQYPVKSILNVPMVAHSMQEQFGLAGQAGDEVSSFCLMLFADLSFCPYPDDCFQILPLFWLV